MRSGPTDLRETFELFRFYRPEVGIERLVQDAGVAHMSRRQIYHAVHDRPPDSFDIGPNLTDPNTQNPDAIASFIAAVSSVEFQENLAVHLLRAFPEKRRMFFVHIPKTGGVDLASFLTSRYSSISTNVLDRTLTPTPEQIFLAIKHIVLEIQCSDTIFISGHTHLGNFQGWDGNGIRYQDQVFTVVREPLQQILSQINYTLTRIFSDESPVAPDTAGWRREFNIENPDAHRSRDEVALLAHQILRHQGVVVPNVICAFLGGGSYEGSVMQTLAHDLEVVEMSHLDRWSEQRWNISPTKKKLNGSDKFVSMKDLSADDRVYAESIVREDNRFFQCIMAAYEYHRGTSVRGSQILRNNDNCPIHEVTPERYQSADVPS